MTKKKIVYIADTFCDGWHKNFYAVLFTGYDKLQFSVGGYQLGTADTVTEIFSESAAFWQSFSTFAADAIAKKLTADKVDLVVDLTEGRYSENLAAVAARLAIKYYRLTHLGCYTPWETVDEYAVRAPFLDKGEITADLLDGKDISAAELMTLDIGIYQHTPSVGEVFRAAECGVPLVICNDRHDSELREVVEKLDLLDFYTENADELNQIINKLPDLAAKIADLHIKLHWKTRDSRVSDGLLCCVELERIYNHVLYSDSEQSINKLLKKLEHSEKKRDWENVLRIAGRLDGKDALTAESYMSVAWGYHFLKDASRASFWADLAIENGSEKIKSQQYMKLNYLKESKCWVSLYDECKKVLADSEPLPEVRANAEIFLAATADRLGLAEQNELYLAASDNSQLFINKVNHYSGYLMCFNAEDVPRKTVYEKHLGYNKFFTNIKRYTHNPNRKHKKIRVGYISPDFCSHVMSNFVWPFLATFNRDKFEVYAYSLAKADQYSNAFKGLVTKWTSFSDIDYAKIAHKIYTDEIDILVDLAGHTANTGLPVLAYKPAPIQISGLGYMTTTGLKEVDYFFTDSFVDPAGLNEDYFVEKLLRLPVQFCYNAPLNLPLNTVTPARKKGYITFAVYNQYTKITDKMLYAWQEILNKVPNSRLIIKNSIMVNAEIADYIYSRFEKLGMDMTRIILEPPSKNYLERLLSVDIALDTFPYTGGATTLDALYMGVPVVSLYNERHSARFSYGILAAIGAEGLASPTIEGYIERAVMLASDLDLLDTLHQNLRTMLQKSCIMQPEKYIAAVEKEYERIFKDYQGGRINIISTNVEVVCGHVRMLQPAELLATNPRVRIYDLPVREVVARLNSFSPQDKNVCVVERCSFKNATDTVDFYNGVAATNTLVIHEFDDSPLRWQAKLAPKGFLDLKACHAMQTSTAPLADLFREYNPYVLTFPNQLAVLPPKRKYSLDNSRVTIFFGALNRKADYQDIMPAINKAIAAYGDKLHFLVTADIDFYNALATSSKEYVGGEYNEGTFAPYELYSAALYKSDIALLPLHDNEFNRMKSDLKFIEAAGHGAVVLCSPTVYQNSVRDGRTGFIYHNAAEFFQLLCALIENPLLRKETAQLAYSYVKENRMLADHYEERLDSYLEMLAKMPELEQARRARIAKTLTKNAVKPLPLGMGI